MNKKFVKKVLIGIFTLTIVIPLFVRAQTGNHLGEHKYITYHIEYLDHIGTTEVDETGITYKPFICPGCESHENTILPERYFGSYALYFEGSTFYFRVIIKNEGPRTYRNLKIETFQEFLNIDGGQGKRIGEDNKNIWFVEVLGSNEEIVLQGEFVIPFIGESGIDQTHLRISHWSIKDREEKFTEQFANGQVILEDFQAGLWCPMN